MHRGLIPGHCGSHPPPHTWTWWWPSSLGLWSQCWYTTDELHCTHLLPSRLGSTPSKVPAAGTFVPNWTTRGCCGGAGRAAQRVCEDTSGGAEVKAPRCPPALPGGKPPRAPLQCWARAARLLQPPRGCDVLSLHSTGNCLRLAEQRRPRAGREVPVALGGTWVCWWHRDPREEPGGLRHCSSLPGGPAPGTAAHPIAVIPPIPASHRGRTALRTAMSPLQDSRAGGCGAQCLGLGADPLWNAPALGFRAAAVLQQRQGQMAQGRSWAVAFGVCGRAPRR